MTNLSRVTAKIFGETATATGNDPEIGQFGSALAGTYVGTNDVATIQSLPAWSNGFIDSVTPSTQFPPLPEMTGFGKVLSYQTAYTMQKGVPEWDANTVYYTGDFCKGVGEGKLYVSLVDNNLNNAVSNTTYWEEFSSGASRNIGEIVASTIPLTDAGLHLLDGSLISGSGIYADFVNYIADLYEANPTANYFSQPTTDETWTQPVATGNTTAIAGGDMVITSSSTYGTDYAAWKAFDGSSTNWWATTSGTTGWWQIVFPYQIRITGLTFVQKGGSGGTQNARFYTDNTKATPIGNSFTGGSNMFDETVIQNIPQEGIVTDTIYLDITSSSGSYVGMSELKITATKVVSLSAEANWQSAVTTYGVCGKFVYDSSNNTVRLPKITGITEGTIDVTALGDLVEAGLPNITGQITREIKSSSTSVPDTEWYDGGSLGYKTTSSGSYGGTSTTYRVANIFLDASHSSSIYGNSATVQPQAVKVLYYIVVATSTKTAIQVDIDEIATDLNGKADVDLTNTIPTSNFATTLNTAGIRTVVETYLNGKSWYRVFSDGWIEQGGYSTTWNSKTSFIKNFSDTNYTILLIPYGTHNCYENACISSISVDGFTGYEKVDRASGFYWVAYGY